jgi:hypothetical protein
MDSGVQSGGMLVPSPLAGKDEPMRTSRWLAMAGAAVAAAALTGCILPPPHDHGRDGGRGDGRYDHRGDRDGDGRWDRDGRPSGHRPAAMASAIDSEDEGGTRWVPDANGAKAPVFMDMR